MLVSVDETSLVSYLVSWSSTSLVTLYVFKNFKFYYSKRSSTINIAIVAFTLVCSKMCFGM